MVNALLLTTLLTGGRELSLLRNTCWSAVSVLPVCDPTIPAVLFNSETFRLAPVALSLDVPNPVGAGPGGTRFDVALSTFGCLDLWCRC